MEIIAEFFRRLQISKTISEVNNLLTDPRLIKYQMDDEAYPQIRFKITKQEIEHLKNIGLIDRENLVGDISGSDPLTKLLYSVLWKNGDLKKIKHVIAGIISEGDNNRQNGLVFYQFGRYLSKEPGEPIIDQHVLRAFGIFKAEGNNTKIEKLKRLSLITAEEKSLIDEYKLWLRTGLTKELRACDDYSYHVDKVLFAVGKSIKKNG